MGLGLGFDVEWDRPRAEDVESAEILCWPKVNAGIVRGRARILTRRIFGGWG